jgi:hypothetical protein
MAARAPRAPGRVQPFHRVRLQNGPVARADVTFCPVGVDVTAGRRAAASGPPPSQGLLCYTSMRRHDRGPRTPDLIGLSAAAAAAAASSRHFSLYVTGAQVDARARLRPVIVIAPGLPFAPRRPRRSRSLTGAGLGCPFR